MFASVAESRVHNVSHNIDVGLGDFNGHVLIERGSSYIVRFKHCTGIACPGAYLARTVFPPCFSALTLAARYPTNTEIRCNQAQSAEEKEKAIRVDGDGIHPSIAMLWRLHGLTARQQGSTQSRTRLTRLFELPLQSMERG